MSDYFALLELTPAFAVDKATLEAAYFRQQRVWHPDRFAAKSASERQAAMQRSVDLNQAYDTLKDPLKRAQYLLHLQGIAVGTEQGGVKPSQALLMETLEWREQVAEADAQALVNLAAVLSERASRSVQAIAAAYGQQAWDAMAQETLRLGYLQKAQEEARQRTEWLKRQA